MKLFYSFLAFIAVSYSAFATTATTTPVGYITIDVPADADTTIAPALEQATTYAGASSSISGNVVGATALTDSAFVTTPSYLQVTSGSLIGQRFSISANGTSSITVTSGTTLQTLGFASGDTFKVVPFWTLDTLFPNGAGVGTTSDALNPTSLVMASDATSAGVNKASVKFYFYCTGDVDNGLPAGWYDNDDVFSGPVAGVTLDVSRMYSIRHTGSATSVVVSGQVPNIAPKAPISVQTIPNDVAVASPFPVDVTLEGSGLGSVLQASTDALNPVEYVFVYDDAASGFNKAATKTYFYCSGDVDNGLPAGWYNNDDVFSGPLDPALDTSKVIKAGRCFFIRKGSYDSAGTLTWATTLPYTL